MHDLIETERLRLRRPVPEDAESIFTEYAQDPDVTRYLSWVPHTSIDETRAFLQWCEDSWSEGSRYPWVISLLDDDAAVGMIELRPDDPRDSVGFVLTRELWDQGYVTEALRAVLHLACGDIGMERVGACCHIANRASARVMEKAGMKQVSRGECSGMYPNAGDQPEESFFYSWTPPSP
ncbi:GNAT family N-acetyltransferase [Gemmatimonadota bacterium]